MPPGTGATWGFRRIRTTAAVICCDSGTWITWRTCGSTARTSAGTKGRRPSSAFDATAAVKPGAVNRIAVRVLSPFDQPIDGFVRGQTPHGGYALVQLRRNPRLRGACLDAAGADRRSLCPCGSENRKDRGSRRRSSMRRRTTTGGSIEFSVAPASGGEPVCATTLERDWARASTESSPRCGSPARVCGSSTIRTSTA